MQVKVSQKVSALLYSNSLISLAGNGVSAVLGILLLGALARWLKADILGIWILYQMSYTLFDLVRMGSLLNPIIQRVAGTQSVSEIRKLIGAAWQIGLLFTVVISICMMMAAFFMPLSQKWIGGLETIIWFVLTSFIAFPSIVATWYLHSHSRFFELQLVRLIIQIVQLAGIVALYFLHDLTYQNLCVVFFSANFSVSLISLFMGWCSISDILTGTAVERQYLFNFAKYAAISFLGANLLRSADVFIVGSVWGPKAVAFYSIPQRFLQILELPIRSLAVTSLPKLASFYQRNQIQAFTTFFHREAGRLWFALLPISLIGIVFARYLLDALGGSQYEGETIVLQIFMIQGLMLPLDRYTSIALDSIGKPKATLVKITIMLVLLITGDLLVVTFTHSLAAVAVVSLITFTTALIIGYWFINKYILITVKETLLAGWREIRVLVMTLRHA